MPGGPFRPRPGSTSSSRSSSRTSPRSCGSDMWEFAWRGTPPNKRPVDRKRRFPARPPLIAGPGPRRVLRMPENLYMVVERFG